MKSFHLPTFAKNIRHYVMNKRQCLILSTGALIFAFFILGMAVHSSIRRIESDIEQIFLGAIDEHYRHRMYYLSYARPEILPWDIIQDMLMPVDSARAIKYVIRKDKGKIVINLPQGIKDQRNKRLLNEYVLSLACPVKAVELDSLFRRTLSHKGITGESGVVCYVQHRPHYSTSNLQIPSSAYSTLRYTLDIAKNVKVQAWMNYDASVIISYLNPVAKAFFLLSLLLALALFFFPIILSKHRNKMLRTKVSLGQGIEIDLDKQSLRIDNSPCSMQKLDLTLLDILHRNMGQCVSRKHIKQTFWPTDDNANEKIDTHIKTIRKVLKDFPHYRLITVRGKGYYLTNSHIL